MAIFDEKIEIRERCKGVHCVDLGESFPTSIYLHLLATFGFDTAENERLKVHSIIQPWDLIFTEPPRPRTALRARQGERPFFQAERGCLLKFAQNIGTEGSSY